MTGPSRVALKHGVRTLGAGHEASLGVEAIERAHDPDLGLDRSVCLREVVEFVTNHPGQLRSHSTREIADAIQRRFEGES